MAERASTGGPSTTSKKSMKDLVPKYVGMEDSMDEQKVKAVWVDMMKYAGLTAPSEETQMSFRFAVYVYVAINGTSRVGNYLSRITMSTGQSFEASVIPMATGIGNVRKFFRSNAMEAYEWFKETGVLSTYTAFVSRMEKLGVSRDLCYMGADFIDNGQFTPAEVEAARIAKSFSLKRASGARNGGSLEDVEHAEQEVTLRAQGYAPPQFKSEIPGRNVF